MVSTRSGILIPVAIVWLGLVCAAALMTVAWISHTGITDVGASARGVASMTAPGTSGPPWTSGNPDPPWS